MLTEIAEWAILGDGAVDNGLMTRVRDGLPGHPRSPDLGAGSTGSSPPEDLADELRGRDTHSDPTGSAAVQSAMQGNRAKDDAKQLVHDARVAHRAMRRFVETAARYQARQANAVETAADQAEPGCMSCARIPGPSGKSPWWNPVTLTTTLTSGAKVPLCDWCYRGEVGVKRTGVLPDVLDVISHRDNGRARKRSA